MISLNFVFIIGIFVILLTALDLYVISHWKKHITSKRLNKYWYVIPYYLSGIMLVVFFVANYLNFFVFPVPEYVKWMNIMTSFWYLPKILIAPTLIFISIFKYVRRKILLSQMDENYDGIIGFGRQKWLGNLAWSFAGLPFILAITGLFYTVNDVKVFSETISFERLPEDFHGFRAVQLSDLHFGTNVRKETLSNIQRIIESLKPDVIFITGDFVNYRYQELESGVEFLKSLKSKYGTFACLGNHDHYMTDEDHQKLVKRIKATGIDLLINENTTLKMGNSVINLVGVDNYGSGQKYGDFEKAFLGTDKNIFTILLNHDPTSWDTQVIGKHFTDLTLSGHTHGGQVAFDIFGFELSFVQAIYRQYIGLYNKGRQYLYVNRGIGVTGPPIRLGINPEITHITLNKPANLVIN